MQSAIELIAEKYNAIQVPADNECLDGECATAAGFYLYFAENLIKGVDYEDLLDGYFDVRDQWPENFVAFDPSDEPMENLLQAAAYIAAQIDRLRAAGETGG